MKFLSQQLKAIWNDESAQGMAEYALLLVIIVAIAAAFRNKIAEAVNGKLDELKGSIGGFQGQ
jgi:Flp pilus assembly pilin Flp